MRPGDIYETAPNGGYVSVYIATLITEGNLAWPAQWLLAERRQHRTRMLIDGRNPEIWMTGDRLRA
jgi:hypothetical protein